MAHKRGQTAGIEGALGRDPGAASRHRSRLGPSVCGFLHLADSRRLYEQGAGAATSQVVQHDQFDRRGIALAFVERRQKGALSAIATSLGDRLREVLPPETCRVEVNGPTLDVKGANGSSSAGLFGLHLLERGTAEDKLTRVFESAAESFRPMVAAALGDGLPPSAFEPHVRVTEAAVDIWWGAPTGKQALVRLRPILRSELRS